jgi:GNAT superfamily N-acetyltransferase
VIFSVLKTTHDRSGFSCGNPILDSYIRERARKDIKRRMGQVYVLSDDAVIIGFFTLSPSSIDVHILPPELAKKFPNNLPLPCWLLGRFAVDVRYQKQGLGKKLLGSALKRVKELSDQNGGYCIIVDAKDETAKQFYEHFGFHLVIGNKMRLYLPIDSITVPE